MDVNLILYACMQEGECVTVSMHWVCVSLQISFFPPNAHELTQKDLSKHTHFPQKIFVLQTSGFTHALIDFVSDFSGFVNAKPQKHPHVSAPTRALSNPW